MERNRPSMERSLEVRDPGLDPGLDQQGGLEGGLKELVLKWFTETQAAELAHNGHFPDWFQGFATRKEAEEQLKEKDVGVFLVRLSEKAFGYVLSYKGEERCRHFVISQSPEGQFCITGDELQHNSLSELIEHYKVCPIQPFGERLTNQEEQGEQEETSDLYDSVNVNNVNTKGKSGVNVQALRILWDKKGALCTDTPSHRKSQLLNNNSIKQEPVLPLKSTRKLNGSVSVDTTALSQCVANKATYLGFVSPASSLDDHLQIGPPRPKNSTQSGAVVPPNSPISTPSQAQVTYSCLVKPENRSQSLPCLEQNEQPLRPPTPTYTPKKVNSFIYSLVTEEALRSNPLYTAAEELQGVAQYAEVGDIAKNVNLMHEDMTERKKEGFSNTYESMEERKTKKNKSKNKEWKNFFTDYMKK
ncbi:hematopoietic SH2 domain-containing protein homolog [Periophthalmus magnuspinnatus]|uniref:hematopoietic SH2 domain-containing protein homolog n=1 Tax=Periophthalmus magnuspinnatus TaxID=409849 RepID=UPI00243719F5|nr:hematopoietic SH2 domain-containing protein homolog [Periophthalmus magnuspinnatus]